MKTFILTCLGIAAVFSFSACTTVESEPAVQSTTTTTEERVIRNPSVQTTETRTIQAN